MKKSTLTPYLLIAPAMVFMALFFAYPMAEAFSLALRDRDTGTFTLANYAAMFSDVQFSPAMVTTLILIVIIIPVQFALALVMALVVNAKLKGASIFLYIYAIPLAISELAAGIVWFNIFTDRGFLNSLLTWTGLLERPFLFLSYQNRGWLIIAVVLAEAWRATSIVMVILVAGLQSIPSDYTEAAEVFGAGLWQRVTRVILPMLKPSLQVALILRTILAFQVFGVALAVAGTGISLLAGEAYRWYYDIRNPNVAAAFASIILVLSILATIVFLVGLRSPELETKR
jgi:multiple sugar transport system permease protein